MTSHINWFLHPAMMNLYLWIKAFTWKKWPSYSWAIYSMWKPAIGLKHSLLKYRYTYFNFKIHVQWQVTNKFLSFSHISVQAVNHYITNMFWIVTQTGLVFGLTFVLKFDDRKIATIKLYIVYVIVIFIKMWLYIRNMKSYFKTFTFVFSRKME